jgi:hypothetical protein
VQPYVMPHSLPIQNSAEFRVLILIASILYRLWHLEGHICTGYLITQGQWMNPDRRVPKGIRPGRFVRLRA